MDEKLIKEIQSRVKGVPVTAGRSNKLGKISFGDLVFVPAQLAKRPVDYYRGEKIDAKTIIGKNSQKPIELATPILIGAMSFGALNKETKIALAKAAALAKTIANTGEGGLVPEERQAAKHLIVQYSTGRFGITKEVLEKADAVEIKIGQGAKPGLGGFLPGLKVTEEIAKTRKMPLGKNIHSPAAHPDIKTIGDLRNKIKELKKIINGKPIILKLAACVEEDIKLAVEAGPDIIALDGMEGGTGASPKAVLDEVGIPTLPLLVTARKVLDEMKAPQELWVGGGFNSGADAAKALALGADAVFLGYALLTAMGAPDSFLVEDVEHSGTGYLKSPLEKKAQKIANFIIHSTEEMKMIAGACGKNNVHDLTKEDLRALTSDTAKITKVKFVGLG